MSMTDQEARERAGRLEPLLEGVDRLPEPGRSTALEAVSALVELYGEGLERVVSRVNEEGVAALAADELLSHLLIVHGLHPVPFEERVEAAVAAVEPYVTKHGGNVELVAVEGGTVRVRLQAGCNGCGSSESTLRLAVEDAIRTAAPEVDRIETGAAPRPRVKGIALPMAGAGAAP